MAYFEINRSFLTPREINIYQVSFSTCFSTDFLLRDLLFTVDPALNLLSLKYTLWAWPWRGRCSRRNTSKTFVLLLNSCNYYLGWNTLKSVVVFLLEGPIRTTPHITTLLWRGLLSVSLSPRVWKTTEVHSGEETKLPAVLSRKRKSSVRIHPWTLSFFLDSLSLYFLSFSPSFPVPISSMHPPMKK